MFIFKGVSSGLAKASSLYVWYPSKEAVSKSATVVLVAKGRQRVEGLMSTQ